MLKAPFPTAIKTLAAFLLVALLPCEALAQSECSKDRTQKQIDDRIDGLIAKMTVDERIAQLQDRAPSIERLGLPAYNWWNEGLHGLARSGYATVFPQAIGLAATWDAPLLQQVGDTVSTEARAKFNEASSHGRGDSPRNGGLTIWSPNINIFRDPRWGRGQETYGEDPFLTATLGSAFVRGIQGADTFYRKADATPKHFVAHSGPESGRDSFNANASAHDLNDTYLPAFHALIGSANADALMCSYNAIDGIPSCANRLLQDTVRDAWRFKGYVVSDCDAVGNLTSYQHYTPDAAHGAAAALNAGVDLDCGNSYLALHQALEQHLTTIAAINQALHRLLLAKLHLGLFDPVGCSPFDSIAHEENDTLEHRRLALRAAQESIVLLSNDGILPLKASARIAVVGADADSVKILEANYHGTASHPVTELEGLQEVFARVRYAQGSLLAAGLPAPIPRTAFRTERDANSPPGLAAEYFDNAELSGTPAAATTVPRVDFDIDRAAPDLRLTAQRYSARWSGFFVPPSAGDYLLQVQIKRCWDCMAHDRFRLSVDGKAVIESGEDGTANPQNFTLHATDNAPHAIQLELRHSGEDEGVTLAWQPPAESLIEEAVQAAEGADAIVAIAGISPELEGEALQLELDGFAGGDRTTLALPATQQALLHRLQQLHKPLILVLNSGSALAVDPREYAASALLEAWYPGEEGGHALAGILSGKTSPSGRLPVTFYKSVADLPAFTDYRMQGRTYRYFKGPVLFPFGFGLSYSQFAYSPVTLSKSSIHAGEAVTANVTLRNAGSRAAEEVVELYIVPPQAPGAPRLTLAGTRRVGLDASAARTIDFPIAPAQFSTVDSAGHRAIRPGEYRVFLGGQQPDPAKDRGVVVHIDGEAPVD